MLNKLYFVLFFAVLFSLSACSSDKTKEENVTTEIQPSLSDESNCPIAVVNYAELVSQDALPDPFHFSTGKALTKKADWLCRRQEIGAQAQAFSLGKKETAPAESVKSQLNGDQLTIEVSHQGKSISFVASITWPKTGTAPYPAIIGMGGSWINNEELLNQGIAIVTFPNNDIAEQLNSSSRGKGKFYDLYGKNHSAGALMAWAWGVSRLIDGIELSAQDQLNAQRLGVTGCSRNGKGALVAGAYDSRIRLTIPQESGSGGSTSWRVSEMQLARGQNVQTLRQIVQENVWFTEEFKEFSESVNYLPYDQHLILGMVAPRAVFLAENTSMEWLGNESAYVSALAAKTIWQSLGIEHAFGFSQQGDHNHCQLPAEQAVEINAFVQTFLLDKTDANTHIFRTDGNFIPDLKRWIPWQTPLLE